MIKAPSPRIRDLSFAAKCSRSWDFRSPPAVTDHGAKRCAPGPDGERFESEVLALYEVRDGKFARAQMFHFDTAALNEFFSRARRGS